MNVELILLTLSIVVLIMLFFLRNMTERIDLTQEILKQLLEKEIQIIFEKEIKKDE